MVLILSVELRGPDCVSHQFNYPICLEEIPHTS